MVSMYNILERIKLYTFICIINYRKVFTRFVIGNSIISRIRAESKIIFVHVLLDNERLKSIVKYSFY